MAVKIEGTCDPKFNRVKDVFAENFGKRNELTLLPGRLTVQADGDQNER
ncbi:hypothetical protein [Candidatus Binatus sp.]